ncbi:MAG: MFS transporter, partial [Microbacteriaceae bacterium]
MALAKNRTAWSDGIIALLGVLFVALSIRSAISGLSPIYDIVDAEIPLDTLARSVLGTLPPVGFVLGGLLTSRLAKPIGLENVLIVLTVLIVAGHVIRGLSSSWQMMAAG